MIRIDLDLSPEQLGRLLEQLGKQGSDSEEKDALYDALWTAHKEKIMDIRDIVFRLEAFARNVESCLEGGSRAVAYCHDEESGEMALVIYHADGSYEHAYPSVLDEFQAWLKTLPSEEPEE